MRRIGVRVGRRLLPLLVILGMLAGLVAGPSDVVLGQAGPSPSPTPPTPSSGDAALLNQLSQASAGSAQVEYHAQTGKVSFIGTASGKPIAPSARASAGAAPESAARAFMASYGPLFGVQDEAKELKTLRTKSLEAGPAGSVVRFQQVYQGIPVFAGSIVVNLDQGGNLLTAMGEIAPDLNLPTSPTIDASAAAKAAIEVTAKEEQVTAASLNATTPELWIYSPDLIGEPNLLGATLVWRTEVKASSGEPIRELVLVDAQSGAIVLHFNQVEDAKNRQTFTANNGPGLPGTPLCNEASSAGCASDSHAAAAHLHAGQTYDFFFSRFGRDSINGSGMQIVSTVHYRPGSVAYQNAFWDADLNQMAYGDAFGYPLADDVVAHELTHGITQYEAGLLYYRQSGAINESISDVFGEFMDLTNGTGTDTAGVKWQVGEDISGLGAIRNMSNPAASNPPQPDRMQSSTYHGDLTDNGGVHINSGVNNKAAFLMVDGGTFNGKTVTGIGIEKAARIYYYAHANLLTPGSEYRDLYNALQQACTTLVGTVVFGGGTIATADCTQVKNAVDAVQMNLPPVVNPPPNAAVCPSGQVANNLFFDNLENTASGNWTHTALVGTDWWTYPQAAKYTKTTSGTRNFHALDGAATSDSVIARTASLTLPSGAFLRFNHAYEFEVSGSSFVDGGVVEYSTNNGSSWTDAGSLFDTGGYVGQMVNAAGSTNPIKGRQAFVGSSDYGASRLNLASLAGQSFRFRFRVGTDDGVIRYGWFIDDIQLYTCGAGTPSAPTLIAPTGNGISSTPTFQWNALSPAPTGYALYDQGPDGQYDLVRTFSGADLTSACPGAICSYLATAPLPAGNHTWWIIAWNGAGWGAWSNPLTYTVPAAAKPGPATLNFPSGSIDLQTFTFQWNKLNPAPTGYALYDVGPNQQYDVVQTFSGSELASVCPASGSTCSYTLSTALAPGNHTWYIIAWNGAGWGEWSAGKAYCILCGFNSEFNNDSTGWTTISGSWFFSANQYYATNGLNFGLSSIAHDGSYGNVDLEVKIMRNGCFQCANYVVLRGTPLPLQGNGFNVWDSGYVFAYRVDGANRQRALLKLTSNPETWTPIIPWQFDSTNINSDANWNTIRAVANGTTLTYYINGVLMGSVVDTAFTTGRIGIKSSANSSFPGTFFVDYARATVPSADVLPPSLSAAQRAENAANTVPNADPKTGGPASDGASQPARGSPTPTPTPTTAVSPTATSTTPPAPTGTVPPTTTATPVPR